MFDSIRVSVHRDGDDLLTAGLGLDGLRNAMPPAFADAAAPTASELRRRAIWSNWRGIADLRRRGTADVPAIHGREFSVLARVRHAQQPHRVLVQVPDGFDIAKRCLVVSAASGSRGMYGSIAVASAWGLPKGFAVACTDKGGGTDCFDLDAQAGPRADGTIGGVGDDLAFVPDHAAGVSGVAFRHAHSLDNPEADWGRHVHQAAQFALLALNEAIPGAAPFTFANTRVIAVGISNGGGAVLRAAELEGDGLEDGWLDAVVAGEPNVFVEGDGGRCLYDYVTEAALLLPCALLDPTLAPLPQPPFAAQVAAAAAVRCSGLKAAGMIEGDDVAAQAASASARLRANGWTDEALRAGALSTGFDLWRAIAVTYASAYGRYGVGEHPCGYAFAAREPDGSVRAASAIERAAWWSDGSGIAPGVGVDIIDRTRNGPDPALAGLLELRALWDGDGVDAQRVRKGIAETRAGLPRADLPIVIVHGCDDGLVPMAFSSEPYVAQARAAGRDVRYWQIQNAQHFDAFLAFPEYGARYVPLLPYVHAALDRMWAHLEEGAALPADAVIEASAGGMGDPAVPLGA